MSRRRPPLLIKRERRVLRRFSAAGMTVYHTAIVPHRPNGAATVMVLTNAGAPQHVNPHLLQRRSPGRRVRARGIWRMRAVS
jgi:hypothetical protein